MHEHRRVRLSPLRVAAFTSPLQAATCCYQQHYIVKMMRPLSLLALCVALVALANADQWRGPEGDRSRLNFLESTLEACTPWQHRLDNSTHAWRFVGHTLMQRAPPGGSDVIWFVMVNNKELPSSAVRLIGINLNGEIHVDTIVRDLQAGTALKPVVPPTVNLDPNGRIVVCGISSTDDTYTNCIKLSYDNDEEQEFFADLPWNNFSPLSKGPKYKLGLITNARMFWMDDGGWEVCAIHTDRAREVSFTEEQGSFGRLTQFPESKAIFYTFENATTGRARGWVVQLDDIGFQPRLWYDVPSLRTGSTWAYMPSPTFGEPKKLAIVSGPRPECIQYMYAEVGNTDFDYQCFEGHEIDGLVSHKTWTTRWYYLLVDLGNAVAGVENQYDVKWKRDFDGERVDHIVPMALRPIMREGDPIEAALLKASWKNGTYILMDAYSGGTYATYDRRLEGDGQFVYTGIFGFNVIVFFDDGVVESSCFPGF